MAKKKNQTGFRDRIKKLVRVRAGDLIKNQNNWRIHPENQKQVMQGVLQEIGYADALLARETDHGLELIDGHLRADLTPDQEVPVLILDLNDEEALKLLASFDPIASMAVTDADKINQLLDQISFDSGPVNDLLQSLRSHLEEEALPEPGDGGDEFDPDPELAESRSTSGDIWLIGGKHRLFVGDCTKRENVELLLDGAKPLLMVTDPPYGVEYDPTWRAEAGVNKSKGKMGKVENDDKADWREAWALFPGDVAYVWHAGLFAKTVQESLEACEFVVRSQIIWGKDRFALSRGHYHWQHEPCWYAVRKNAKGHWGGDRSQSTLWSIKAREDGGVGHGTQKPIECMARPMRNHGQAGDLVYDPFLGSGTSLIAAHRLGRVCYGCELNPRYADVILKRAEAEGLTTERIHHGNCC